jgi:hypothetical protein
MEVATGVGIHSLCLAKAVGEAGHLFLYESRPIIRKILEHNLAANRVANVTVMRRALRGPRGLALSADITSSEVADSARSTRIPDSETLDELQLERLDWLKINDGILALEVLKGATDTVWRLRPCLFIAAADQTAMSELAGRVKELSYRCWRAETSIFNPENFNRRESDIFAGRTDLALLAIPEEIEIDIALPGCIELS